MGDLSVAAVFVDRDGVINELVPDPLSRKPESPLRARDVVLIAGAAAALRRLLAAGWTLVGVSNQPAAAKGRISLAELLGIQARVIELLLEQGVRFHDFRLCLHHPDGSVAELTRRCDCRKPAPGMILDAARQLGIDLARSWMIGDTDVDVLAGRAAGCHTALIEHPGSAHKRCDDLAPDAVAADLGAAVDRLLQRSPR
ncbi:MAG: D-glycero-alpha-D-manno-heptose-1,7-bisphosphate 7-phosphatase [Solirubrobacteraceae bacterium]